MADQEKPQPENPQFALANRVMDHYIGALQIAGALQDEAMAAEGRALEAEDRAVVAEDKAKTMEERAHIDPTTRLPNKYVLEEDYQGLQDSQSAPGSERERATDPGQAGADEHSILMLDLDHFKDVNDKGGGHAWGNRVLRKVASTMKGSVRRNDLVVRLHGEEFAILLPRTSAEQAAEVGEKVRAEVERTGFVTTSVGTAGLDLSKSLEDNLVNADIALYRAKEGGRNQVVRYEDVAAEHQAPSDSAPSRADGAGSGA